MSAADTRAALEDAVERAIAPLNAWDGEPDLEDGDEDDQCDDEGAIEEDDDREMEASLCGVEFGYGRATDLGRFGGFTYDLEDQCEDEGAYDGDNDTSDDEPSLCGIGMASAGGVGVFRDGLMHYDLEANGDEQ